MFGKNRLGGVLGGNVARSGARRHRRTRTRWPPSAPNLHRAQCTMGRQTAHMHNAGTVCISILSKFEFV